MSKVIELTDKDFNEKVLQSKLPFLVDFWTPWCQPCLMMAPILEELSEELSAKLKIGKLNAAVSAHQTLAAQYNIQSIPNMKLFKEGKIIKEFIGLRPKEVFKAELEKELRLS